MNVNRACWGQGSGDKGRLNVVHPYWFTRVGFEVKTQHKPQGTVDRHELLVVQRSMFATDGTMLWCHVNSNRLAVLEKLPTNVTAKKSQRPNNEPESENVTAVKLVIVDVMTDGQSLQIPDNITNSSRHVSWRDTAKPMKSTLSLIAMIFPHLWKVPLETEDREVCQS